MKYFKQGLSHPLAFSALLPVFLSHPLPDPSECINPFQGWVITEKKKEIFPEKAHSGYYRATFVDMSFHN